MTGLTVALLFLLSLAQVQCRCSSVLRIGSRGECVKVVQRAVAASADGSGTKKLVIAFQNAHGLGADGIVGAQTWNAIYGSNSGPSSGSCPLSTFTGSQFQGKSVRAHKDFIPLLQQINTYAQQAGVRIYVTSSFRTSSKVPGSIVQPAKMSNHMVGQAIDMNVIYGSGSWCNSKCLGKNLPAAVQSFISKVRANPKLRWGGDFRTKDPVHIDTGLNVKDTSKWKEEFRAVKNC